MPSLIGTLVVSFFVCLTNTAYSSLLYICFWFLDCFSILYGRNCTSSKKLVKVKFWYYLPTLSQLYRFCSVERGNDSECKLGRMWKIMFYYLRICLEGLMEVPKSLSGLLIFGPRIEQKTFQTRRRVNHYVATFFISSVKYYLGCTTTWLRGRQIFWERYVVKVNWISLPRFEV